MAKLLAEHGQIWAHFEHLGCLAPEMGRMGLRELIWSIWAPWSQIWPERASEEA